MDFKINILSILLIYVFSFYVHGISMERSNTFDITIKTERRESALPKEKYQSSGSHHLIVCFQDSIRKQQEGLGLQDHEWRNFFLRLLPISPIKSLSWHHSLLYLMASPTLLQIVVLATLIGWINCQRCTCDPAPFVPTVHFTPLTSSCFHLFISFSILKNNCE